MPKCQFFDPAVAIQQVEAIVRVDEEKDLLLADGRWLRRRRRIALLLIIALRLTVLLLCWRVDQGRGLNNDNNNLSCYNQVYYVIT